MKLIFSFCTCIFSFCCLSQNTNTVHLKLRNYYGKKSVAEKLFTISFEDKGADYKFFPTRIVSNYVNKVYNRFVNKNNDTIENWRPENILQLISTVPELDAEVNGPLLTIYDGMLLSTKDDSVTLLDHNGERLFQGSAEKKCNGLLFSKNYFFNLQYYDTLSRKDLSIPVKLLFEIEINNIQNKDNPIFTVQFYLIHCKSFSGKFTYLNIPYEICVLPQMYSETHLQSLLFNVTKITNSRNERAVVCDFMKKADFPFVCDEVEVFLKRFDICAPLLDIEIKQKKNDKN